MLKHSHLFRCMNVSRTYVLFILIALNTFYLYCVCVLQGFQRCYFHVFFNVILFFKLNTKSFRDMSKVAIQLLPKYAEINSPYN